MVLNLFYGVKVTFAKQLLISLSCVRRESGALTLPSSIPYPLQVFSPRPPPLKSSWYTSHTKNKRCNHRGKHRMKSTENSRWWIVWRNIFYFFHRVSARIESYCVLPYRACCTACVVHRQNIPGRQSDTGLGSAWGSTPHLCLMLAALRDAANTINLNICSNNNWTYNETNIHLPHFPPVRST